MYTSLHREKERGREGKGEQEEEREGEGVRERVGGHDAMTQVQRLTPPRTSALQGQGRYVLILPPSTISFLKLFAKNALGSETRC